MERAPLVSFCCFVLSGAASLYSRAVASCTAYLEEILEEDDMVHNIDKTWRQFRFSVGAPDAEARFKANVDAAVKEDKNAKKFPSLYVRPQAIASVSILH